MATIDADKNVDKVVCVKADTISAIRENNSVIQELLTQSKYKTHHKVYGIKINKTDSNPATRITYIEDCENFTPAKIIIDTNGVTTGFDYGSWRDVWFVKNNYPCILGYDGKEICQLDPNDYTKDIDGNTVDISSVSVEGNVMSCIPRVWVKFDEDDDYEYIYVSKDKIDDDYQAIAHTLSDGTVVDKIYLSIYIGSQPVLVSDHSNINKLRSLSGYYPSMSKDAQEEVDMAQENNPAAAKLERAQASGGTCDGWYTWTWGQYMLLTALLLIMGRSDDSQTTFGSGVCNTYVNDVNVAYGMQAGGIIHSDYIATYGSTTNTLGQFWGTNDNKNHVKVFHIEDMWGNQCNRIAGLISNYGQLWAKFHGPYVVGSSETNEDAIATELASKGYTHVESIATSDGFTDGDYIDITRQAWGYATHTKTTAFGRFPVSSEAIGGVAGSSSTYTCDYNDVIDYMCRYAILGTRYTAQSDTGKQGYESFNFSSDWYDSRYWINASLSYI